MLLEEKDLLLRVITLLLHLLILPVMIWVMVAVIQLVTVMDEQLVVDVREDILLGLDKEEFKEILQYL